MVAGADALALGDGLRCGGGSVIRLGTKTNASGTSHSPDSGDQPISIKGSVPSSGGTRTYQAWYRNAADFCTAATVNLTNGVSIARQPCGLGPAVAWSADRTGESERRGQSRTAARRGRFRGNAALRSGPN